MNDHEANPSTPAAPKRQRGLTLTDKAVQCLEEALRQRWQKEQKLKISSEGRMRRLCLATKAAMLDMNPHTLRSIYDREPVDEWSLSQAFTILGISPPFTRERYCVCAPPPYVPTPCIGRETEAAEIKALLQSHPLVTLTGIGGIGKTRLALQVLEETRRLYPAGVWFVEFADLSDSALVPQQVATMLGIQEEKDRSLLQQLADFLRQKPGLLVLDNCEHLLSACTELAHHLLASASSATSPLRILATSRERLHVACERAYPVPPLALPETNALPDEMQDSAKLLRCASARLFVERAQQSGSGFTLTGQNAPRIASICRRLEGIPLALELAAARAAVMPLDTLERKLDDRFRLLVGDNTTAPARLQSLQAALDWSVNLLTEQEKTLLLRLSLFAGDWQWEEAEQVCVGDGAASSDFSRLLTSLLENSLVIYRRAWLEQSLMLCRDMGDRCNEGNTLCVLGYVIGNQGEWNAAHAFYEQSLAVCQEIGYRNGVARAWNALGGTEECRGDSLRRARTLKPASRCIGNWETSPALPTP